jgi:hypothetical protein
VEAKELQNIVISGIGPPNASVTWTSSAATLFYQSSIALHNLQIKFTIAKMFFYSDMTLMRKHEKIRAQLILHLQKCQCYLFVERNSAKRVSNYH